MRKNGKAGGHLIAWRDLHIDPGNELVHVDTGRRFWAVDGPYRCGDKISILAIDPGSAGNLAPNTKLYWVEPRTDGIVSMRVDENGLSGGEDVKEPPVVSKLPPPEVWEGPIEKFGVALTKLGIATSHGTKTVSDFEQWMYAARGDRYAPWTPGPTVRVTFEIISTGHEDAAEEIERLERAERGR